MIEKASADSPRREVAVVLGSGLLDDVPLASLAQAFARVDLVDVVHPWPARLQVLRHRNVRLVTADLSGSRDLLRGNAIDLQPPNLAAVCDGADLVISANLLSQLPLVPLDRLDGDSEDLGRRIVSAHLDALSRLDAQICLITDVEQIEEDRQGEVVARLDLMHGHRMPTPEQEWIWELAPFGEVSRRSRLVHRVFAYPNWRTLP